MKTVSEKIVEKIKSLGRRKGYAYKHIQLLLEMEGYKKPSMGFISKILGSRSKSFKKIV